MLPYYTCNKAELASFAANRKLKVQSTAKFSKEPTRNNLIQALKYADIVWTFNFLGLPAELRTNIYKELLVLQDSFTCHPQILQTCKLVNGEASNILYGDNLIEVKIHYDGVYVHGARAGNYTTEFIWFAYGAATRVIDWPPFIRKAQFMRVAVISYISHYSQIRRRPLLLGRAYFILHSFCSFLRMDNRLRALEVDMSELKTLFTSRNALPQYSEGVSTAVYPLRLLPNLKRLHVEGITEELTSVLVTSNTATKIAKEIASGNTLRLLNQTTLAESICLELTENGGFRNPDSAIMADFPLRSATEAIFDSAKLLKVFMKAVELVRIAWDRRMEELPTDECKKRVKDLVQLEVEVKLAMDY